MRRAFLASEEFQKLNPADLAWTSQSAIVLKEIAPSLRLFLDLSDVVIGLNIARDRFEEAEIDFVRRSVRPGDHVVDVGANIGFFSIWMASLVGPLGQVYAYEPLEQNAALLEKSARENGFEDRIVLRRDAVASRGAEGSLVFLSLEQGRRIPAAPICCPRPRKFPETTRFCRPGQSPSTPRVSSARFIS